MHTLPLQVKRILDQTGFINELTNGWMRDALAAGGDPDDLVEGLVRQGRPQEVAALLVGLAQKGLYLGGGQGIDPRAVARSRLGSPEVAHGVGHRVEAVTDRDVRILLSTGRGNLRIVLYDNFLGDDEIDYMKQAVHSRLERSTVVGPGFSSQVSSVRTSSNAFLNVGEDPLLARVEQRIAACCGVPVNHGENMQVLYYASAEEYQPHYDFFEPNDAKEAENLGNGGNRCGTMLMYMNDVERGGGTYFPKLDLVVHPRKGLALWFEYLDDDEVPDYRSEHAGLPITMGVKWLATKWVRRRAYQPSPVPTDRPVGGSAVRVAPAG